jgi:hypothetical protein
MNINFFEKYWGFGSAEGFAIYSIKVCYTPKYILRIGEFILIAKSANYQHEPPLAMPLNTKRLFENVANAKLFVTNEIEQAQQTINAMLNELEKTE